MPIPHELRTESDPVHPGSDDVNLNCAINSASGVLQWEELWTGVREEVSLISLRRLDRIESFFISSAV